MCTCHLGHVVEPIKLSDILHNHSRYYWHLEEPSKKLLDILENNSRHYWTYGGTIQDTTGHLKESSKTEYYWTSEGTKKILDIWGNQENTGHLREPSSELLDIGGRGRELSNKLLNIWRTIQDTTGHLREPSNKILDMWENLPRSDWTSGGNHPRKYWILDMT